MLRRSVAPSTNGTRSHVLLVRQLRIPGALHMLAFMSVVSLQTLDPRRQSSSFPNRREHEQLLNLNYHEARNKSLS